MDATVAKPRVFGRGTDLDRAADQHARFQERRRREELEAFAQAVRSKDKWFYKILDGRDLGTKWAAEAELDEGTDRDATIRELQQEARRICILDHTLRLSSVRLPERDVNATATKAGVQRAVHYLRAAKHGMDQPKLFEDVGVYCVDDIVPKDLHTELVHALDQLADAEPKDFHPGSHGKVQDLIHPSLYPYVANETPLPPSVTAPRTHDGKFETSLYDTHPYGINPHELSSAFAWIPAVFNVSDDGRSVKIDGYINGLGSREQCPVLYELLEQVFLVVLPLLEKTTTHEFELQPTPSYLRWEERSAQAPFGTIKREEWDAILAKQAARKAEEEAEEAEFEMRRIQEKKAERAQFALAETVTDDENSPASGWAGHQLKVIVKAANYVLQPGQEYTGSWHLEGMPHERIVSSAIYYYDRDESVHDAGLYLRRKRNHEEFPHAENARRDMFSINLEEPEPVDDNDYIANPDNYFYDRPSDYGGSDVGMGDLGSYVNVGVVPTTGPEPHVTGRIVTFPNWVQHRVMKVSNTSVDKTVTRKILCFFLVDDVTDGSDDDEVSYHGFTYAGLEGMHVLSSVDVPSQARACNIPTLRFLLGVAFRQRLGGGRILPPELTDIIISAALVGGILGMTREEAEIRRRALMADRKVGSMGINQVWELEFSLCEH